MEERQETEESFIKLHPVPKTHLFMKKITRIQAIDRQIRKKWIQIKRNNQQQNLTTIQQYSINPSKNNPIAKHTLINFQPGKNHTQVNTVQNSLKRQQILNNHKRQEEIFFRRKSKSPQARSPKNQKNINLMTSSKKFISVESSRRRVQTEAKSQTKTTQINLPLNSLQKVIPKHYFEKSQQKRSTSLLSEIKKQVKVPFMLEKIKETKKRQREALASQSQKQLIELSTKSRHHMKQWAIQRKSLYQKLKGSRAYYIMKSPTRLSQVDDVYIF